MKNFKQIIILAFLLCGCFPSFYPDEVLKDEIRVNNYNIKWYKVKGVLDQNFPDIILIERNKIIDTLCTAYNVSFLNFQNDTLLIGFFGKPNFQQEKIQKYKKNLPLVIDTISIEN